MTTITKIVPEVIWAEACAAAAAAVAQTKPKPMVVGEAVDLFSNDIDYTKPTYVVKSGICGFAWVVIKPARGQFVTWLKANRIGYKAYEGGWQVSSSKFANGGQSLECNIAAASAAAEVLRKYGLTCYDDYRLD